MGSQQLNTKGETYYTGLWNLPFRDAKTWIYLLRRCSHLCVWERKNMDAVLYEDGLDLSLKLSSTTQNPYTMAVGIEGRAFPWINAHHDSVVLGEDEKTGIEMRQHLVNTGHTMRQKHNAIVRLETGAQTKSVLLCAMNLQYCWLWNASLEDGD